MSALRLTFMYSSSVNRWTAGEGRDYFSATPTGKVDGALSDLRPSWISPTVTAPFPPVSTSATVSLTSAAATCALGFNSTDVFVLSANSAMVQSRLSQSSTARFSGHECRSALRGRGNPGHVYTPSPTRPTGHQTARCCSSQAAFQTTNERGGRLISLRSACVVGPIGTVGRCC